MARSKPHLIHFVYAFTTGGMEKVIATVVNGLDDFEHTILCSTTSGPMAELLPANTRVIELNKPPGNSLGAIWKLRGTLRALAPDLLCTYNWDGMDGILAAGMGRVRPIVQHEHGWGAEDPDGTSPKRRRLRRVLTRWTARVITVSKELEHWLVDDVRIRTPVTQIYNGIDHTAYSPGPRDERLAAKLGVQPDAFAVGVIARLDPIKNHRFLFEAFTQLREERPNATLLVVGDGPDRVRLHEFACGGVVFLGDRRDVPDILRTLDVFVLPSVREGISMTILEAMASACPTIATRVGGNPELIIDGETGTLVELGDVAGLTGALARYAADPALAARHATAARERLIANFTVEQMVDRYRATYAAVLR